MGGSSSSSNQRTTNNTEIVTITQSTVDGDNWSLNAKGDIEFIGDVGVTSGDALTAIQSWLGYQTELERLQGSTFNALAARYGTHGSELATPGGVPGAILERDNAPADFNKIAIVLGGGAALFTIFMLAKG